MSADQVLDRLRAAGLACAATDDGGLRVGPRHLLTDLLREDIRSHRAELLALLAARPLLPPLEDPLPPGARDLLGWIDMLGPLPTAGLAAALGWPLGMAMGMALRMKGMGLLRQRDGCWYLSRHAESFALWPAGADPVFGHRHAAGQEAADDDR